MTDYRSHSLTRRTFLGAAAAAAGTLAPRATTTLQAQPSAPVVTRTDVIYGRVEGSALLANLAYPDGPGLRPAIISVHGGRWRAGNRTDASSIKVTQWAEFGFVALSIDYRLVGGSPAPALLHRHALRHPLGARACRRLRHRPRTHLPHRSVSRRTHGVTGRDDR